MSSNITNEVSSQIVAKDTCLQKFMLKYQGMMRVGYITLFCYKNQLENNIENLKIWKEKIVFQRTNWEWHILWETWKRQDGSRLQRRSWWQLQVFCSSYFSPASYNSWLQMLRPLLSSVCATHLKVGRSQKGLVDVASSVK